MTAADPQGTRAGFTGADTVVTGLPVPGSPVAPASPTIPDVIIMGEIGRGGMGVVYRGRQAYIDRQVAVKLLINDGSAAGQQLVRRFQREATILAQLNHAHIVACYSAGTLPDGACYLVMEFIDGPNLWQHVQKAGALTEDQALRVVRDIAAALGYAQQRGIIHRDVKPENVLLQPAVGEGGFPWIAKLVDLGLARPVQVPADLNLTQQGMLIGTPATMAPEQFENPDGVDFRADIYGLGCVLYQALAGRPTFSGNSLVAIVTQKVTGTLPDVAKARAGLSPGVAALAASMLARKPEDRPQSYADLVARCDALLAGPVTAPTRRWPYAAMVGMVVAAVVGVALTRSPAQPAAPTAAAPMVTAPATAAPITVTPPAVIAQPPQSPAQTPVEAALGPAKPLVGDDLRTALAAWVTVPGWGLAEDSDGLIGHSEGTSRITHPLPDAPWRVTGVLRPALAGDKAFSEAGLRIELGDGSAMVVTVKYLQATAYAALAEVGSDGVAKLGQLLKLPAGTEWALDIACQRGQLRAEVGGVVLNPLPVRQPTTALSLTVSKGAVAFSKLALATP